VEHPSRRRARRAPAAARLEAGDLARRELDVETPRRRVPERPGAHRQRHGCAQANAGVGIAVISYSATTNVRVPTAAWKIRLLLRGIARRIETAKRLLSTPSVRARRRA
jgi:hypothetical protein